MEFETGSRPGDFYIRDSYWIATIVESIEELEFAIEWMTEKIKYHEMDLITAKWSCSFDSFSRREYGYKLMVEFNYFIRRW